MNATLKCQWRIPDYPEVGASSLGGGATYDFAKFSQKLHEIEFGPPGAHVPHTPLRSATECAFWRIGVPQTAESNPGFATE